MASCVRIRFVSSSCPSIKAALPGSYASAWRGGAGVLNIWRKAEGGKEAAQASAGGRGSSREAAGERWSTLLQSPVATSKVHFLANALYGSQAFSKVCFPSQPAIGCPLGNKGPGSPICGEAGQGRGGVVITVELVAPLSKAFSSQTCPPLSGGLEGTAEPNSTLLHLCVLPTYHECSLPAGRRTPAWPFEGSLPTEQIHAHR